MTGVSVSLGASMEASIVVLRRLAGKDMLMKLDYYDHDVEYVAIC